MSLQTPTTIRARQWKLISQGEDTSRAGVSSLDTSIKRPTIVGLVVKPIGKPSAGNRHARFDERGWETGRWPSAPSYRAHPQLYLLLRPLPGQWQFDPRQETFGVAELARGISPRAAHRSAHKPLDLYGSCHRAKAAAFVEREAPAGEPVGPTQQRRFPWSTGPA